MTPAETIQAAIDKLLDQAAAADHGPYYADDEVTGNGHVIMGQEGRIAHVPADVRTGSETAELLVTLHATIDAQIAILQDSINYRDTLARAGVEWVEKDNSAVLSLARAILGEQVGP